MAIISGPHKLADTGTTGNNTHASIPLPNPDADAVALLFVVEAVGATPTVTWKVQGSLSPSTVTDANSVWFDIPYVTEAAAAEAVAARTATAVGAQVEWLALPQTRFFQKYRLVSSANTNLTYRAELYTVDRDQ